jgi:pimeloyl-ACP methyl ester carboxylesterase
LGFDVWMGNNRGNIFSSESVNLNPKSKEFWQFTWDEMAKYDFPNMVGYVLNATQAKTLGYVGHSEGTLQVFAGLSVQPEFVSKLNSFVGLGPVVEVGHITNFFFKFLADTDAEEIFVLLGDKQFLPDSQLLNRLFAPVCRVTPALCDSVIEFICGPHRGAFNNSRMQVVASHEPDGTSVNNMVHFAQAVKKKNFAMYDWGSKQENEKHYGQHEPPNYNFSNFPSDKLPVALYYGNLDELADPTDVAWIIGHLNTPPQIAVELNDYAHLDYVWDDTAYAYFYPQLIDFLKTYAVNAF